MHTERLPATTAPAQVATGAAACGGPSGTGARTGADARAVASTHQTTWDLSCVALW